MIKHSKIIELTGYNEINGVVPGVRGQRAFPTRQFRKADPFLMLDHIGPQEVVPSFRMAGEGHPHRGFETITFLFEGQMEHKDSLGNSIALGSGDVQYMNAGAGIVHGGDMWVNPKKPVFHEVQLWVNVPSYLKMTPPRIQSAFAKDIPSVFQNEAEIRIIAGSFRDKKGIIQPTLPINLLHVKSSNSQMIDLGNFPEKHRVLIYILDGKVKVDDQEISAFQTIHWDSRQPVELQLSASTQLLIMTGEPINEPVAFGGPFVMNTEDEIQQAYADYQAGKFGKITN